ncbi:pentapeptide repeat-containing protein [Actinomadura scrupuli]|uniref:pentapeptide repeat-containing protein n=1 Tax=Actinomadura scrupuli TaxID=559629 RepID=UPI003D98FC0F
MGGKRWLVRRSKQALGQPARLMPVWAAFAGTFTVAIATLAGLMWAGLTLLGVRSFKPERALTSSTLFDLVKLAFAVVAGIGGLVALVVAYRRQRLEEGAALREATKLHTDRFTAATAQLGSDSSAIQLAGAHALAGLADDAPTRALRQTCIDILCAYLRMPYDPDPGENPTEATPAEIKERAAARHTYRSLREVRHTIIRTITAHLRDDAEASWQGHDFDFTEVVFDGGDFTGARFTAYPDNALHGRVTFTNAVFSGGTVDFRGAVFSGATVHFGGTSFSGGTVHFGGAMFSGGMVDFGNASFSGGMVDFGNASFSGGTVGFGGVSFSGGRVHFGGASFSGGTVHFGGAMFFSGTVGFGGAVFSGATVHFGGASFSGGTVHFGNASFFGGTVHFMGAMFPGGTVDFEGARFSGATVGFGGASFSGATVSFYGVLRPTGIMDLRPAPGVTLPDDWAQDSDASTAPEGS